MDLNNKIISINFNDIDLIKDLKNEKKWREFYQEPSKYSARNSEGKAILTNY